MSEEEKPEEVNGNGHAQGPKTVTKTKVLADGTYATETVSQKTFSSSLSYIGGPYSFAEDIFTDFVLYL
jgi:hypothetical protein